jgi:2-hydroxychromene-2-carboxylate isomerase
MFWAWFWETWAMKKVELIFDFASPNIYLALPVLREVVARTGATLEINACFIGGVFKLTGNKPPIHAFADVKGKIDYEMLELRRFVKRHGLHAFKWNPFFPLNSIHAQRGLLVAQAEGVADAYIDAVLKGFWEDGLAMGEQNVVADVLTKAGLDGADLMAKTGDSAIKAKLMANTDAAVARGVFGMPTFFVGKEMFFGKERLGQVEEALLA